MLSAIHDPVKVVSQVALGFGFAAGCRIKLLPEPGNGGFFIRNEKRELGRFTRIQNGAVVFRHLVGQEIHTISAGETLVQTSIEFRRGNGYHNTTLNVKSHHTVEE